MGATLRRYPSFSATKGQNGQFVVPCPLTFVLQGLRRFPGRGARPILAGLQSRAIQNRKMALAALVEWERDAWPDEVRESLEAVADAEPDEKIRDEM
jgi:hypothetical protein